MSKATDRKEAAEKKRQEVAAEKLAREQEMGENKQSLEEVAKLEEEKDEVKAKETNSKEDEVVKQPGQDSEGDEVDPNPEDDDEATDPVDEKEEDMSDDNGEEESSTTTGYEKAVLRFKAFEGNVEVNIKSFVSSMLAGLNSRDGKMYYSGLCETYSTDKAFELDELNKHYSVLSIKYGTPMADKITTFHAVFNRIGKDKVNGARSLNMDKVLTQLGLQSARHLFN